MKKILSLLLFSVLGLTLNAQNVEKRTVGDYEKVSVSGWFDVELVNGNEGEITLRGKESVLEYIDTEVVNGRLKIEWAKRYNFNPFTSLSKVHITVPVTDINSVSLSGSGSIKGKTSLKAEDFSTYLSGSGKIDLDINSKTLRTGVSGSGDLVLRGQTNDHDTEVTGSGDIEAYELESDFVNVNISGSADVNVKVNKGIRARISGSGDVNYIGSPDKIDSKVSGSGSVSKGK